MGGWQAGGRGAWGAGPRGDDDAAIAAIRRAVERGVTWVDTAASYGLGHSEDVVRRALEPWCIGDEVFVFTKCGHPWDPPDRIRTDLAPASIRRECEGSLRRLGVERIDLYQFHHADPSTPVEESWATMADLVREGKVRWAGVSNFDVELLDRCQAIARVESVQPELNLLRRGALDDVIPWCRDRAVAALAYSPTASGELVGRLRGIADRVNVHPAALAVAWTLTRPGVTGVICGARSPAHVDGWVGAADLEVPLETLAELESITGGSNADQTKAASDVER
jgi:aryl-alcohol dehydrogenase-like predicted oxidoreductase